MTGCARAARADRCARRVCLAAAFWLAAAGGAAAQTITYTGSAQVATGNYVFTEPTTSISVVNGVEVARGPVRVSATIPFVVQSTPWITYSPVPLPSGGPQNAQVADQIRQKRQQGRGGSLMSGIVLPTTGLAYQSGVADPVVRGDVRLFGDGVTTAVRAGAAVKFPMTDPANGLGTGEWDYGVTLAAVRQVDRNSFFGSAAYWHFGDMPDLPLRDAAAYGAGYERLVSARWSVSASLTGWTTIIDGLNPPIDLGFGVTRSLAAARSVSVLMTVGLTQSAPDFSVSVGWQLPILRRQAGR